MRDFDVLVLPDCHVPFHDKRAFDLVLRVIEDTKPAQVVCLGDFADMLAVSGHNKDFGYTPDLDGELREVKKAWKLVEAAQASRKLTLLEGNHENRLARYVSTRASAVESITPSIPKLFGASKRTVFKPYQELYHIGHVVYVHDVGHAGKAATHQSVDAAGQCIVLGHTHRLSVAYTGTTNGSRHFGMSCGWLGDPKAIKYMSPAKTREWQLGFGLVSYRGNLAFAQTIPIVDNKCFVDGKVYK